MVVRDDTPFSRKEITDYLEFHRIDTGPILAGNILHQPAYNLMNSYIRVLIMQNGFFVGVRPGLSAHDLRRMADVFYSFFGSKGIA
jgi:hypothetical protein